MPDTSLKPILLTELPPVKVNVAASMARVRTAFGKGYLRQLWEMLVLRLGPGHIHPIEYMKLGLYHPSLDWSAKRAFRGRTGANALNKSLYPGDVDAAEWLVKDKILATRLMASLGAKVPAELAIFPDRPGLTDMNRLEDKSDMVAFLSDPMLGALHGKPIFGSRSLGHLDVLGAADTPGMVRLSNGRVVSATAITDEIIAAYPDGYVFQERLDPHPGLGPLAVAGVTLRIVTVRGPDGALVLYATMKVPGHLQNATEMSGSAVARVLDPLSGVVIPGQKGPDDPLTAVQMPDFAEATAWAASLHNAMPNFGVLGWDFMPTPDGPVCVEVNTKPFHDGFEAMLTRGIMNPDFAPLLTGIQDRARARIKADKQAGRTKRGAVAR